MRYARLDELQAGVKIGRRNTNNLRYMYGTLTAESKGISEKHPCFIDYIKAFDCVDNDKLWEALREIGIPDHLTCLLRNQYVGQEATVRTQNGATDWFKIEKGV